MLGHLLMLVTIIPEEESLMRDCTYKMLVINDRLDYLSLHAHQSMDLLSCGLYLFVMACHGEIHCTSFNDGNPMINGKNALVTVTVDLGWCV